MKIGAPGRAVRMPEKSPKEKENYLSDKENSDHQTPYVSWLCSNSHEHHYSRIVDKTGKTDKISTFWDQQTIHRREEEILTHRPRNENIKICNNRPSTAVRRHVKKISEDFTITQTKYKYGTKPAGIIIHIESSDLKNKDKKVIPSPLNTIFSPKTQSRKAIRNDTICSKCGPSKNQVMPLVTTPPVTSSHKLNKVSLLSIPNSPHSSTKPSSRVLSGQNSFPLSLSTSPSLSRSRKLQGERPSPTKSIRRRKFQSASAGQSNGVLKVPFEQVKKAKLFAQKAVNEGRVFAIHGAFPAVREALVKRGWVEKVLHTIPYVNPHPQNCVCTHVGWHVVPPLHHHHHHHYHHHHHNQSSSSSDSSLSSTNASLSNGSVFSVKSNDVKKSVTKVTPNPIIRSEDKLENSQNMIDNVSSDGKDICETEDIEEERDTSVIEECSDPDKMPRDQDNGHCVTLKNYINSLQLENIPVSEENELETIISGRETRSLTTESKLEETVLNKNENLSSEYLKKLTKTLNTAFLGPSEIREGIQKSINKKNLSIFQYSVPPYERKRNISSLSGNSHSKNQKIIHDPQKENLDFEINKSEAEINGDHDHEIKTELKVNKEGKEKEAEEEEGEEEEKEEERTKDESQKEVTANPFNPFPKLDYVLTNLDKPVVARVLRNVEPNFIWSWNRDSISFKHLSKEQLVNRFPNTPFTTKFGLCETLQQLHWFSEAAGVDTFVPRGYCIGHEDERAAFIHDYRTTACLNILKWMTKGNVEKGSQAVAHPMGEVPVRRVRQALQHVEGFIQSCCHDDLDTPPLSPLRENEWDLILTAHHRIIHQGKRIKALPHHVETLLRDCQSALERVEPFWPQLRMDGMRNVWIVKPGAQSRGRGIFLLNHLEEILALVQSPLIYQTKYVVQKYMERPLLIHNTKFDIRQWFMVTDWNPLTVWMYKESYLRFCSQQYDLTNNDEAIHLSNNAIQCKYMNGNRDKELPEENMWDCHQFREYLRLQEKEDAYEKIIYPGMKDALIATMLAAQVQMDSFKHGFEFFGADFMLTEDLRPWLIEINSSPCMASTTSVTKRMCFECLNDTIKVVVDYRQNKSADTGNFELIYHDKEKSVANLPYHGVSLQVVGRQIWKPAIKQDKRRTKKIRPVPRVTKSIPLITLQLEESGEISPAKTCPLLNCQNYSQKGPTLTTIVTSPSTNKFCSSQNELPPTNEMGNNE